MKNRKKGVEGSHFSLCLSRRSKISITTSNHGEKIVRGRVESDNSEKIFVLNRDLNERKETILICINELKIVVLGAPISNFDAQKQFLAEFGFSLSLFWAFGW